MTHLSYFDIETSNNWYLFGKVHADESNDLTNKYFTKNKQEIYSTDLNEQFTSQWFNKIERFCFPNDKIVVAYNGVGYDFRLLFILLNNKVRLVESNLTIISTIRSISDCLISQTFKDAGGFKNIESSFTNKLQNISNVNIVFSFEAENDLLNKYYNNRTVLCDPLAMIPDHQKVSLKDFACKTEGTLECFDPNASIEDTCSYNTNDLWLLHLFRVTEGKTSWDAHNSVLFKDSKKRLLWGSPKLVEKYMLQCIGTDFIRQETTPVTMSIEKYVVQKWYRNFSVAVKKYIEKIKNLFDFDPRPQLEHKPYNNEQKQERKSFHIPKVFTKDGLYARKKCCNFLGQKLNVPNLGGLHSRPYKECKTDSECLFSIDIDGNETIGSTEIYKENLLSYIEEDEIYEVHNADVDGFYPQIAINCYFAGHSLGIKKYEQEFILQWKKWADTRLKLKKNKYITSEEKSLVQGLKLMLNSLFGKLGDPYSKIQCPKANQIITINGQLILMDLQSKILQKFPKTYFPQVNTDGFIFKCLRKDSIEIKNLLQYETSLLGMSMKYDKLDKAVVLGANSYAFIYKDEIIKSVGSLNSQKGLQNIIGKIKKLFLTDILEFYNIIAVLGGSHDAEVKVSYIKDVFKDFKYADLIFRAGISYPKFICLNDKGNKIDSTSIYMCEVKNGETIYKKNVNSNLTITIGRSVSIIKEISEIKDLIRLDKLSFEGVCKKIKTDLKVELTQSISKDTLKIIENRNSDCFLENAIFINKNKSLDRDEKIPLLKTQLKKLILHGSLELSIAENTKLITLTDNKFSTLKIKQGSLQQSIDKYGNISLSKIGTYGNKVILDIDKPTNRELLFDKLKQLPYVVSVSRSVLGLRVFIDTDFESKTKYDYICSLRHCGSIIKKDLIDYEFIVDELQKDRALNIYIDSQAYFAQTNKIIPLQIPIDKLQEDIVKYKNKSEAKSKVYADEFWNLIFTCETKTLSQLQSTMSSHLHNLINKTRNHQHCTSRYVVAKGLHDLKLIVSKFDPITQRHVSLNKWVKTTGMGILHSHCLDRTCKGTFVGDEEYIKLLRNTVYNEEDNNIDVSCYKIFRDNLSITSSEVIRDTLNLNINDLNPFHSTKHTIIQSGCNSGKTYILEQNVTEGINRDKESTYCIIYPNISESSRAFNKFNKQIESNELDCKEDKIYYLRKGSIRDFSNGKPRILITHLPYGTINNLTYPYKKFDNLLSENTIIYIDEVHQYLSKNEYMIQLSKSYTEGFTGRPIECDNKHKKMKLLSIQMGNNLDFESIDYKDLNLDILKNISFPSKLLDICFDLKKHTLIEGQKIILPKHQLNYSKINKCLFESLKDLAIYIDSTKNSMLKKYLIKLHPSIQLAWNSLVSIFKGTNLIDGGAILRMATNKATIKSLKIEEYYLSYTFRSPLSLSNKVIGFTATNIRDKYSSWYIKKVYNTPASTIDKLKVVLKDEELKDEYISSIIREEDGTKKNSLLILKNQKRAKEIAKEHNIPLLTKGKVLYWDKGLNDFDSSGQSIEDFISEQQSAVTFFYSSCLESSNALRDACNIHIELSYKPQSACIQNYELVKMINEKLDKKYIYTQVNENLNDRALQVIGRFIRGGTEEKQIIFYNNKNNALSENNIKILKNSSREFELLNLGKIWKSQET